MKSAFNLPISNNIGDYSVYKMRGSDKLIFRSKGGPTKEQIKTRDAFSRTRKLNSEFSAVTKCAGKIKRAIFGVKDLSDFNLNGGLTKILMYIKNLDTTSMVGQREIIISKYRSFLEAFSFNRGNPFDSIVTTPVSFTISRGQLKATVQFPELQPGINFNPPASFGFYRFIAVFGIVSDVKLIGKSLNPANPLVNYNPVQFRTDWLRPGLSFLPEELILDNAIVIDDSCTMMLSVGIEFGVVYANGVVEAVKNMGSGKVLGLG